MIQSHRVSVPNLLNTSNPLQAGDGAEGKGLVCLLSSSDHSDIVTLGDLKDDDHAEEAAAANEEFYLGTSCSSQYAFTAGDTGTTATHLFSAV